MYSPCGADLLYAATGLGRREAMAQKVEEAAELSLENRTETFADAPAGGKSAVIHPAYLTLRDDAARRGFLQGYAVGLRRFGRRPKS
jgi:hypothetical protein